MATIDPAYESEYDMITGAWGYRTEQATLGNVNPASGNVTVQLDKGYYDDFYFDYGWTVSGTATAGIWERGVPIGTMYNNNVVNPTVDVIGDFGNTCFVTGNGGGDAGTDDVDGGSTVLTTPSFNATGYTDPYIQYRRWFANTGGTGGPVNDTLKVTVTNGIETKVLEIVTAQQNGAELAHWITKSFRIADFLSPTSAMKVSFHTADSDPGHLVEAAVDVFEVLEEEQVGLAHLSHPSGWFLYPNPASNKLQLVSNTTADGTYRILSITGAQLSTGQLNESTTTVNTAALSNGFYLVEILSGGQRSVLHFIKQ
jgi:hypothetical protein